MDFTDNKDALMKVQEILLYLKKIFINNYYYQKKKIIIRKNSLQLNTNRANFKISF